MPGADDTEGRIVCEAPYHLVVGRRLDLPGGVGACVHGIMIAIVAMTFGGITQGRIFDAFFEVGLWAFFNWPIMIIELYANRDAIAVLIDKVEDSASA